MKALLQFQRYLHQDRVSFVVRLDNKPGSLENVLRVLREQNKNLTRIESKPSQNNSFDLFLDVEGSTVPIDQLKKVTQSIDVLGPRTVPWFPRQKTDLDSYNHKTLNAGSDLESDHPGFTDIVYRERRNQVIHNAKSYNSSSKIPTVDYSDKELETWKVVFNELTKLYPTHACDEFNAIFHDLQTEGLYSPHFIPQLQDLSGYLKKKSGFTIKPVSGLLSQRDFLNGLAVKCFHSTQYIRHHSKPLYTPEPDVIHELLGHVPMLANKNFAQLSHDIGLGASDSDIRRLASCYWFSVEFGLVEDEQQRKRAYGAGLLSSFGELKYSCGNDQNQPEYLPWDPEIAAETEFPITTYQPKYFTGSSLEEISILMRQFCDFSIKRPFYASFDEETGTIMTIDRKVVRKGSIAY